MVERVGTFQKSLRRQSLGALATGLLLWAAAVPARGQALDAARHVLSGDGSEPCVFCHTPSGTEAGVVQPVWAGSVTLGTAFGTFDTAVGQVDQGEVAPRVPASSVACLSCHDGTQASEISARIVRSAENWSPVAPLVDGAGGPLPTLSLASVQGVDSSHPVGVRFRGIDQSVGREFRGFVAASLRQATVNGQTQWWLDTEAAPNGLRDKTDIIFYTRQHKGRPQPFIECGSCHDPHSAANRVFLRVPNAGSRLCFACHPK